LLDRTHQLRKRAARRGTTPIVFDASPYWGAPDVASPPSSGGITIVTVPDPIASVWGPTPDEVGPFSSAAPSEPYSTSGTLDTLGFDATAAPSTGDIWESLAGGGKESFNPLFLQPGLASLPYSYTLG
jgi:hypothetical protein